MQIKLPKYCHRTTIIKFIFFTSAFITSCIFNNLLALELNIMKTSDIYDDIREYFPEPPPPKKRLDPVELGWEPDRSHLEQPPVHPNRWPKPVEPSTKPYVDFPDIPYPDNLYDGSTR